MNKKLKILLIIIITIIVLLLGYIQVKPLYIHTPEKNFEEITITEADSTKQDNKMALSFLYNISKNKHPVGSEENYKVKDYIIDCLNKMNLKSQVKIVEMNEKFFLKMKDEKKQKLNRIKEDYYNLIKQQTPDSDVDSFIKNNSNYNSFDDFYKYEVAGGNDIEEILNESYNKRMEKYNGKSLTNILVPVSTNNITNSQNILFVAHYDSAENSYGASDDGMSVAGLLETIRILKNNNFKNNIYVLFTDGEEESFLGANEFIKNNIIRYDLIINFDNAGSSGNLTLYHYSNDNIAKQYFKATKRESTYSLINEILYNPKSTYYQGKTSDAFLFIENGYTTLDFALSSNPFNYHSENDSFSNIDIKALENATSSMIEMMNYYGNNMVEEPTNDNFINFKIFTGFVLSIPKTLYIVLAIVFIIISILYLIKLFKDKKKIITKLIVIALLLLSIVSLILLKNFSILFTMPLFIIYIPNFFKNDKLKKVFKTSMFELYIFIIIQLVVPLIEYSFWVTQLWGKG